MMIMMMMIIMMIMIMIMMMMMMMMMIMIMIMRLASVLSSRLRTMYLMTVAPSLPPSTFNTLATSLGFGDWLLLVKK